MVIRVYGDIERFVTDGRAQPPPELAMESQATSKSAKRTPGIISTFTFAYIVPLVRLARRAFGRNLRSLKINRRSRQYRLGHHRTSVHLGVLLPSPL